MGKRPGFIFWIQKTAGGGGVCMLEPLILNDLLPPCPLLKQYFCKFTSIYLLLLRIGK